MTFKDKLKLKNIEVDFDDYASLRAAFNLIKPRLVELDPKRVESRADKDRKLFEACQAIISTDISTIYSKISDSKNNYYVYAHCDPSDIITAKRGNGRRIFAATQGFINYPFYIGKGTGNRAFDLNRNETHRKKREAIKSRNRDVNVVIVRDNMSEREALALEAKLIDIFGILAYGGPLTNLDEGTSAKLRHLMYIENLRVLYPHDLRFKSVDEIGSIGDGR